MSTSFICIGSRILCPEDHMRFLANVLNSNPCVRLSKVEDAQAGYEVMRTLYDKKIYPNLEGLRNVVRLLGKSSEPIRKLKVEDIVDDRVVRKLEKEGLF